MLIGSVLVGLFLSVKYGENELVSETDLVPLYDLDSETGAEEVIYVSISDNNKYFYRYEVNIDLNGTNIKNYKTDYISANVFDSIIETEDEACKKPILQRYRRKALFTIWSFGLYYKNEYIFRVPPGTIQKNNGVK